MDTAAQPKPFLLALLALIVVGVALWPSLRRDNHQLWAQVSPVDTPTLTPTVTETPAPTPTKVKRVVNEITHPGPGDAMAGTAEIIGTVLVEGFLRYDIHISAAGMEDWQWLTSNYEVIHDDVLYRLDTPDFADGFYDIRARAIRSDGGYTESFLRGVEILNARPPTSTPVPNATAAPLSPLVTPTATPDLTQRKPGGQGFYAPDSGTVIRGVVDIIATVNGAPDNPFDRYELFVSPAGVESWTWLAGGSNQAWQSIIHQFDTTVLPDGLYDLRLRIVYRDSNYDEYFLRNLSIANAGPPTLAFRPQAGFVSPRDRSSVSGVVDFIGTVPAKDLLRWELFWSPGGREEWTFLTSSSQPVRDGVLARLDLSALPSGKYDFRLRVVRTDFNYTDHLLQDVRVTQP